MPGMRKSGSTGNLQAEAMAEYEQQLTNSTSPDSGGATPGAEVDEDGNPAVRVRSYSFDDLQAYKDYIVTTQDAQQDEYDEQGEEGYPHGGYDEGDEYGGEDRGTITQEEQHAILQAQQQPPPQFSFGQADPSAPPRRTGDSDDDMSSKDQLRYRQQQRHKEGMDIRIDSSDKLPSRMKKVDTKERDADFLEMVTWIFVWLLIVGFLATTESFGPMIRKIAYPASLLILSPFSLVVGLFFMEQFM